MDERAVVQGALDVLEEAILSMLYRAHPSRLSTQYLREELFGPRIDSYNLIVRGILERAERAGKVSRLRQSTWMMDEDEVKRREAFLRRIAIEQRRIANADRYY